MFPGYYYDCQRCRKPFFGHTVGAEADGDRIQFLLSEVKGKDITELIASGREKLASVPSGGAAAVAAPASGGGGAVPAASESKKEEKVEEKEESDDVSINCHDSLSSCALIT